MIHALDDGGLVKAVTIDDLRSILRAEDQVAHDNRLQIALSDAQAWVEQTSGLLCVQRDVSEAWEPCPDREEIRLAFVPCRKIETVRYRPGPTADWTVVDSALFRHDERTLDVVDSAYWPWLGRFAYVPQLRVEVEYRAGLAPDIPGLETDSRGRVLRSGMLRMAAFMHSHPTMGMAAAQAEIGEFIAPASRYSLG